MAIRKINSRSIEDGSIATADIANNAVTDAKFGYFWCWFFYW